MMTMRAIRRVGLSLIALAGVACLGGCG